MPCPGGFAVDWIEDLYAAGMTNGCSEESAASTARTIQLSRGQMAVFVVPFHC